MLLLVQVPGRLIDADVTVTCITRVSKRKATKGSPNFSHQTHVTVLSIARARTRVRYSTVLGDKGKSGAILLQP